ncbi:MAG: DinB family protein [Planctomycetaceae bacterium]|nr:DinB family protein [Planctomycetaceae bacterium]
MTAAERQFPQYEFNRTRTLGLLDTILKEPNPQGILGWRPGPGRAHIAWQLMHIGVTEEIFATERLAPEKAGAFSELWPRFRGGSTPDDEIPTADLIREVLTEGREHLLATLRTISDDRLGEIPAALAQRKLTIRDVLQILAWHEPHHQGQAHITFNLYKAAHAR